MKIFFSVGEPSGDLHGANLIREMQTLYPEATYVGYGGPLMEEAGCKLHLDLTKYAIMGFLPAIMLVHKFWGFLSKANQYFRDEKPDAVVLIDYPGFNWWIARKAKAHGIPVYYYGTPQLWAWGAWRVKKMQRFVDHVLCKLPFEPAWYKERGCTATYVGHPYFDELRTRELDQTFVKELQNQDSPLVTILPGSRDQEVAANLETFLKSANIVQQAVPNARFAIAAFKESQAETTKATVQEAGIEATTYVGRTPELIEAATCCMAVSGSVSLELLFHAKPSVILYQASRRALFGEKFFRKVKFITLANLLAVPNPFPGKPGHYDPNDPEDAIVPMPEYLTWEDKSKQLAAHITEWLTDEAERTRRVQQLQQISACFDEGGASKKAAVYILTTMGAISKKGLPSSNAQSAA